MAKTKKTQEIKSIEYMWQQIEFTLRPRKKGFHLVTDEIMSHLPTLPKVGLINLFIKHTSAALTINENADPDVLTDMKGIFDRLSKPNTQRKLQTYKWETI